MPNEKTAKDSTVVVVGGGLAGLACAVELHRNGKEVRVLEAGPVVGGRVQTEIVGGFRLDYGFHVFQTAYPEAQRLLDYGSLKLQPLDPGASIFRDGRWHAMTDPWRRPGAALSTLFNPIGGIGDRIKLMRLRRDAIGGKLKHLVEQDCTTEELFRERYAFSDDFIEGFLRPWWAGIFLESDLITSAAFMSYIFSVLSSGDISYPEEGIGALAANLAAQLPDDAVELNAAVHSFDRDGAITQDGRRMDAACVVAATGAGVVDSQQASPSDSGRFAETSCLYFSASDFKKKDPTLLIVAGASSEGPVNHVFPISNASPKAAPEGQTLLSVNLVGDKCRADEASVRAHLRVCFGDDVDSWELIQRYDLTRALPLQPPGFRSGDCYAIERDGVIHCGDAFAHASVGGVLRSGMQAAELALNTLK